MCALKLVSSSLPKVTDKVFQRKYIALGRIVTCWEEIIGQQMAQKAQPVKIRYKKTKDKKQKPDAVLEIAVSSANASLLSMQKGVILERINQIFGDQWITDIRFIHQPANFKPKSSKPGRTLSDGDRESLSNLLDKIDDPVMRERLNSLGEALLKDHKQ